MRFYKMNGLGNAFAIFDARRVAIPAMTGDMARSIADPDSGIGCDQVIVLEEPVKGDVFMRIFNADGGEVKACGNAARCVAWLEMEATTSDTVRVETEAGILKAARVDDTTVSVDMGSPLLRWEEIPLAERMDTRRLDLRIGPIDDPILHSPGAVNMGNPHCVFFVDDVSRYDVKAIGSLLEAHPLFPERANIGFAEPRGRGALRLRVWERGAGLTLACGTGACAAVVACHRRGLTDRQVEVELDGGTLSIHWREDDDKVQMTGPVELEYESELG